MWIALVFDRKEQSGRGKQQHILFFRPRSLVKTLQGFLLLFVVVIPSWCGSFCFLFVFLGEDRETALGGEKIYTTIFFLFFLFCFISCFYVVCFFFLSTISSQVKACFFSGTKKRYGRRDDFLPRFSFFRLQIFA